MLNPIKSKKYCTVFQAEVYALLKATELILGGKHNECSIFSDSRSALDLLRSQYSFHPLIVTIRKNLVECERREKTVAWYWVRAHVGLEGNERADALAKEAALHSKKRPDYDAFPVSYARRKIRDGTIVEWDEWYRSEGTASVTKLFLPDAVAAYKLIRKIKLDPILVQVLTGHGGFSEYLARFKCNEDPSCFCEPETAQTVPYILVSCPGFALRRYNAECAMNAEISLGNIRYLISDSGVRGDFLEYCKEIAKIAIERNKTR